MDTFLFIVFAVVTFIVSEIAIEWNDIRLTSRKGKHRK